MKYLLIPLFAFSCMVVQAQPKGKALGHDKEHPGKGNAYGHYKQSNKKHVIYKPVVRKTTIVRRPVVTRTVVVPSLVRTRFVTAYPRATRVVWYKKPNSIYTANYYEGPYRTTTTYNANGTVVETRTYIPVTNAPQPVVLYREANPSVGITDIVRLLLPNREPVYRLRTTSGSYVYINENGYPVTL